MAHLPDAFCGRSGRRQILFCLHEFVINDSLKNCLKGLYCNQPLWAGGLPRSGQEVCTLAFHNTQKVESVNLNESREQHWRAAYISHTFPAQNAYSVYKRCRSGSRPIWKTPPRCRTFLYKRFLLQRMHLFAPLPPQ